MTWSWPVAWSGLWDDKDKGAMAGISGPKPTIDRGSGQEPNAKKTTSFCKEETHFGAMGPFYSISGGELQANLTQINPLQGF